MVKYTGSTNGIVTVDTVRSWFSTQERTIP